jgi:hypothetical protein
MDADYYLETIRRWCSRSSSWSTAPGTCATPKATSSACGRRTSRPRALHHRRRAGRHLRQRPDRGRARLCYNVPKSRQKHLEVKGAGHYGIFSGRRWRDVVYPQVRDFIKQFTTRAQAGPPSRSSGPAASAPARGAEAKAAATARTARCGAQVSTPQAARLHAALPQTQCTRCGYPDCAGYARPSPPAKPTSTNARPAAPKASCTAGRDDRPPALPLNPANGVEGPAHAGRHRRELVHRLHAVPGRLPHRRHPRRQQAHAHGDRAATAPAASCACRCARWTASRWRTPCRSSSTPRSRKARNT